MSDDHNQAYDLAFRAIGADVIVYGNARILAPEAIALGDSVIIDDLCC